MVTLRTCDDGVKAGKAHWSPPRGSGGVEAPPCPPTVRRRHQLKTFRTDDENISHRPLPSRSAVAVLDHLAIQCADVATSAAFYDTVLAPLGGAGCWISMRSS